MKFKKLIDYYNKENQKSERKALDLDELESAAGGYPEGEFPDYDVYFCPRCGAKPDRLTKLGECVLENPPGKVYELVLDKTYRSYECQDCHLVFWRYGYFWEIIRG